MTELIKELKEAGISVLPLKYKDGHFEHPLYNDKFDTGFSNNELSALIQSGYSDGIAVMHGKCNPQIICLDFDEKNAIGKNLFDTWRHLIDEYLFSKLIIEKTRSNGYHVYFKCSELPTAKALANSESGAEWIACRSSVNNCITYCSPSPGYTDYQGSLTDIQEITPQQMRDLCDAAVQLNEYSGAKSPIDSQLPMVIPPMEYSAIIRTFDQEVGSQWIVDYLYNYGWTTDGVPKKKKVNDEWWEYIKLWRPGYDYSRDPYSANYWINRKNLSVFSSSTPLPSWNSGQSWTHSPSRVIYYMNDCDWNQAVSFIKKECERLNIEIPIEIPMAFSMVVRNNIIWKIEIKGIIEWAIRCGYRWLKLSSNDDSVTQLIKVVDNVIYEVTEKELLRDYVEEINKNYADENPNRLLTAFIPSVLKYMDTLPVFDGELMRDSKEASYIYFSNGALKITAYSTELIKYSELPGCVFVRHIKNFNYEPCLNTGVFGEFIQMICIDEDHLKFLKSCIGYVMHYYKLRNFAKALIIIEDVDNQDEARGRSGKGIIAQYVEWIRWSVQQDGRNYKSDSQFKMQRIVPGVQVYYLNDPSPGVLMNQFYNFITDDWLVEAKGKKSYSIPFKNSPKILITTNYLPNLESDSDKDRFVVLPIKKVFGASYSIRDAFPDVIFFDDHWDAASRNGAIRFAIECIQLYLRNGVISYVNEDVSRNADMRIIKNMVPEGLIEAFEQAMEVAVTAKSELEFNNGLAVHDLRKGYPETLTKAFGWEPKKLIIFITSLYQYCLKAYNIKDYNDKKFGKRLRLYIEKMGFEKVSESRNNSTGRRIIIKTDVQNDKIKHGTDGSKWHENDGHGTKNEGYKPFSTEDDLPF